MEEMYGMHPRDHASSAIVDDLHSLISRIPAFTAPGQMRSSCTGNDTVVTDVVSAGAESVSTSSSVKAMIAAHPRYPRLLEAYIDCRQIGAPPEIVSLLDNIRRESGAFKKGGASVFLGTDPELDKFMEMYCDMLLKYKAEISRPFDEAVSFIHAMKMQLSSICQGSCFLSDECPGSSEDEFFGDAETPEFKARNDERDLKSELLRKYGGYLGGLKQEFSKKKKKGKLPKEARQTLLDWWTLHYKWPYPTEADKIALAETTGLNQKQINNWFINQRKRHWKPSENMQFAVMDNLSVPFYLGD